MTLRKPESKRWIIHEKIFFVLIIVVLVLAAANLVKAKGWLIPEQPTLQIKDGTISLRSMTLEQKIAQMVIVSGSPWNVKAWKSLQVGGIHLFALERKELFHERISQYQQGMQIPFFVSVDLEGCLNPFAYFREFPAAAEITSLGEAFEKGSIEGKFLSSLGINLNFAPVVDLQDQIWKCRSFPGDEEIISEFAEAYILGLQKENIIATAKHYPGKTLVVKDPHKFLVAATIDEQDIYPFTQLTDVSKAIMVSHIITSGIVDSQGVPSVVSPEIIGTLKEDFAGLIISDEINMLGLRNFYSTLDEMYIAVFKAGNDIILNFNEDPNEIYRMIQVVAEAVETGEISEEQIDDSVTKILRAKGFTVVD